MSTTTLLSLLILVLFAVLSGLWVNSMNTSKLYLYSASQQHFALETSTILSVKASESSSKTATVTLEQDRKSSPPVVRTQPKGNVTSVFLDRIVQKTGGKSMPVYPGTISKDSVQGKTGISERKSSANRCRDGVDHVNRTEFWKYNDDVFPGLHDVFAKNGTVFFILLVEDKRTKQIFGGKSTGWVCSFEHCSAVSYGEIYSGSKQKVTEIVGCPIPKACALKWAASDPNCTQTQDVTLSAKTEYGTPFTFKDVKFCRYPEPAQWTPRVQAAKSTLYDNATGGDIGAVGPYALEMAACTMLKVSLLRYKELVLEWIAYHKLQGFQHFYIYSNDADTKALAAVVQPYIDERVVDIIHWVWTGSTDMWAHQV